MAQKYLEQLTGLIKKVGIDKNTKLELKHFFGGAACYGNGKIFASLSPAGFALKLPEKYRDELIKKKKAKRLKYFPNGHIKKEYALLSKRILANKHQLKKLVDESIRYVVSERK